MILPILHIIVKLVGKRPVSNRLADIEPLVADVLGLVQTFLLGIVWNTPERNLHGESSSLTSIIEEVARIRSNGHTQDPITPALAEALGKTCGAGMCIAPHLVRVF